MHKTRNASVDVILVRPQIPENAGFVARSVKAFGAGDLVLVAPAFPLDTASPAYKTASGAAEVLGSAGMFSNLEEAAAPYHHVAGFTRRGYDGDKPHMELTAWADGVREQTPNTRTALVFGPEDFGLSNQDRHLCTHLVTIPLAAETLSLNLAHTVTIALYEVTRGEIQTSVAETAPTPPATHADLQRLTARLVEILDQTHYFKAGRRARQVEKLRSLVQRLGASRDEYSMVMGVLGALDSAKVSEEREP